MDQLSKKVVMLLRSHRGVTWARQVQRQAAPRPMCTPEGMHGLKEAKEFRKPLYET